MAITGSSLEFDLDFTGNSNILFGPVTADSSYYKLDFTGDSNVIDWKIVMLIVLTVRILILM